MKNSLSYSHREKPGTASVFPLVAVVSLVAGYCGWGFRDNQVLDSIKKDPITWVNSLPLHKQIEIKNALRNIPDEPLGEVKISPNITIDNPENTQ